MAKQDELSTAIPRQDADDVEERLPRSERRFRALVAHSADATILLDRQGRVTYASPACVRLLGHSPAAMAGRTALEFIHPDDLGRARVRLAGHLSGTGPPEAVEYRVLHSDGSWRLAEVTTTNLFGDPSVDALVINIRDITEERAYRDRLEASERRFRALVANSWDVISLHSTDGRWLYCSPAVTTQMGYRADDLVGEDPFAYVHPDDIDAKAQFREVLEGRRTQVRVEYRFPHRDGSWRWMESVVHNLADDPAVGAVAVTTRDVTSSRRRAAQHEAVAELGSAALRGAQIDALFRHAVEQVAAVLEVDCCYIAFEGRAGAGSIEVRAEWPRRAPAAAGADGWCALAARALRERRPVAWNSCTGDRSEGPVDAGMTSGLACPISSGSGLGGALAVCSSRPDAFSRDDGAFLESVANVLAAAVARRRIEEELRRQALHDTLTGLPNRVLISDRLETALGRLSRRGGSVAVLFVDLDNFKLVNDTLGHSAGDSVVASVATRIVAAARTSDTVARFGGDEFVVMSEDTDGDGAARLAERIRRAVSSPIDLSGRPVLVTASVGFAVTSDPHATPDGLMAEADMAMYEAKQSGKDCSSRFAPHMRSRVSRHLDAVSGIRRGLAAEEFRLFYQPIVDTRTGMTVGTEALLRWQHPTSGLLGPANFIDYAEASGLIIPLGEWVLRTALRQSAQWRSEGQPSRMSVNISGVQLTGSDVVSVVSAALSESGAQPRDISLEVTENAVMSDLGRAAEVIRSLKSLGVHVGMDDFGTGQSSLSQLSRLPFDFVKIDRSFVGDFSRDPSTAAMLDGIATLCHALGLPTIAEGVETDEQRCHLERIGVDYLQGFLFGRPQPPDEVTGDRRQSSEAAAAPTASGRRVNGSGSTPGRASTPGPALSRGRVSS